MIHREWPSPSGQEEEGSWGATNARKWGLAESQLNKSRFYLVNPQNSSKKQLWMRREICKGYHADRAGGEASGDWTAKQ